MGVCAGVHALGIDSLFVGPVAVGGGTVETSHGRLPVPAPATALLLADVPIFGGPVDSELTTPTGAALLKSLAGWLRPDATALDRPRRLRRRDARHRHAERLPAHRRSARRPRRRDDATELVALLETNIDHLPAEELAFAAEELLGEGALDVWQTPIVMKKGRSAVMLSVLASPSDRETRSPSASSRSPARSGCAGSCSSARSPSGRAASSRRPWGPARVKVGAGRVRPEHDDVARIARDNGLPYRVVAAEIERLATEPTAE